MNNPNANNATSALEFIVWEGSFLLTPDNIKNMTSSKTTSSSPPTTIQTPEQNNIEHPRNVDLSHKKSKSFTENNITNDEIRQQIPARKEPTRSQKLQKARPQSTPEFAESSASQRRHSIPNHINNQTPTLISQERFAGPAFSSPPPANSLPIPDFTTSTPTSTITSSPAHSSSVRLTASTSSLSKYESRRHQSGITPQRLFADDQQMQSSTHHRKSKPRRHTSQKEVKHHVHTIPTSTQQPEESKETSILDRLSMASSIHVKPATDLDVMSDHLKQMLNLHHQ